MKRSFAFLLALWLLLMPVYAQMQADVPQTLHEAAEGICTLLATKDPLADKDLLPAGDSSGDWIALTFALAGEDAAYARYAKRLEKYVTETYKRDGGLGAYSATQGQRIVLTAAALGLDPTAFGGTIDLLADSTYDYHQGEEELFDQGLNACIFALLALDCRHYPVPRDSRYTRDVLVHTLLAGQNEDGSFGLSEGHSDADMTAMAVQALSAYRNDDSANDAAQRALDWLSAQRDGNGLFPSESSETVAQTIIAVTAMGLDPQTEPRFVQNGVTLPDALEKYRQPDGSFAHGLSDGEGNVLATQQAMLALIAVEKQKDGGRLYDFTGFPVRKNAQFQWAWFVIPAGAAAGIAAAVITIRRKKHHG